MGTPLVTSSGHHWRLFQPCSLDLTVQPPGSDTWWLFKELRSVQVAGTHSTGMFSCIFKFFSFVVLGFQSTDTSVTSRLPAWLFHPRNVTFKGPQVT